MILWRVEHIWRPRMMAAIQLLVLGGNGFVGSHVCKEALERGLPVLSLNRYKTSLPNVTFDWARRESISISGDFEAFSYTFTLSLTLTLFLPQKIVRSFSSWFSSYWILCISLVTMRCLAKTAVVICCIQTCQPLSFYVKAIWIVLINYYEWSVWWMQLKDSQIFFIWSFFSYIHNKWLLWCLRIADDFDSLWMDFQVWKASCARAMG